MSFCSNLLELDIYGKKPVLNVGNYNSLKTFFGSILSIITFLFMLVLVIYFGLQVILKHHARIIVSITNIPEPPPIFISQKNFSFALGLQNSNFDQYIDETIYKVRARYVVAKRIKVNGSTVFNYQNNDLKLIPCDSSHFPHEYSAAVSVMPLLNMYCAEKLEIPLYGVYNNEAYSYIQIEYSECVNTTDNNFSCVDRKTMDSYLSGAYYSFAYTEITVDPSNTTNPNQIVLGDIYNIVTNKFQMSVFHELKTVHITTDSGLIFKEPQTNIFLQTKDILSMNSYAQGKKFLSYQLKLSTQIDIYQREYTKVQDVIAQIGGMMNFLTTCGMIVCYFYTEIKYGELLINQLFEFKNCNKDGKVNSKISKVLNNRNRLTILNQSGNFNLSSIINIDCSRVVPNNIIKENAPGTPLNHTNDIVSLKENVNTNINQLRRSRTKVEVKNLGNENPSENKIPTRIIPLERIHFEFFEAFHFFFCFCFKKKKEIFFKEALNRINNKLDIVHLLKCFDELDRMKFLLLDNKQRILFNCFPKRVIVDYEFYQENFQNSIISGKLNMSRFNDLQKYYSRIDLKNNDVNDKEIMSAFNAIVERVKSNGGNNIDQVLIELLLEEGI
jgi:hypothetical protein